MKEPQNDIQFTRTKAPKKAVMEELINNPLLVIRELNNRSLYTFLQFFWDEISSHEFVPNWHVEYLCSELEKIAYTVGDGRPKQHDLIINVPPGTTKTITCSIMFPIWCWTRWHWMRFITGSYSGALALESAEYSRDLIRSDKFRQVYPELAIKEDKDTKSNFKVIKKRWRPEHPTRVPSQKDIGGNRFSTSVGGTMTGFHGDILIIDDPLNPHQSASDAEIKTANRWMDNTLSTRKTDKAVSTIVTIMQRVHENDPSGHMLAKKKANLKHICLPGEIRNYRDQLKPKELEKNYRNGLLDPKRMNWDVLKDLEADLGQYGYAGQIGQKPTPPGGGMFKVDNLIAVEKLPPEVDIKEVVRYWDKAGSQDTGAYTVGVKIARDKKGEFHIVDVKRFQKSAEERERIIRQTAEADGKAVKQYIEQEPGSGGKESAESTIRNLAGFRCEADRPTGDKVYRADPFSVQVNSGNVTMLKGDWNHDFVEELRFFPFGTYKDQVDAASGAFEKVRVRNKVKIL